MQRSTLAVFVGAMVVLTAIAGAGVGMAMTDDATEAAALQTAESSSTNQQTITVSTSGDAEAQPDKAVLRLAVEATSPDATEARNQVAENVSDVKNALSEMGVAAEDIRTRNYNIYRDERPRPVEKETPPEPEYRARHQLVVDLDNVGQAGQAIDAAIDAGATDINGVEFTVADETQTQLRSTALEEAMSNARMEAETLASSENLEITGVQSVTTERDYRPRPRYETAMAAGGDASTEISSGPVSVTASVTVTYNVSG